MLLPYIVLAAVPRPGYRYSYYRPWAKTNLEPSGRRRRIDDDALAGRKCRAGMGAMRPPPDQASPWSNRQSVEQTVCRCIISPPPPSGLAVVVVWGLPEVGRPSSAPKPYGILSCLSGFACFLGMSIIAGQRTETAAAGGLLASWDGGGSAMRNTEGGREGHPSSRMMPRVESPGW